MAENTFGYCQELPEEHRAIFQALCQDLAMLHLKWDTYLTLFGPTGDAGVLSGLVDGFLRTIEDSLRADMTMTICRLSDRMKSVGKENLTFSRLPGLFPQISDLAARVDVFNGACEPLRLQRDKLVAHNDLRTRLKPMENPLPGIGRAHIDQILSRADGILNHVLRHHADAEMWFVPHLIGGAKDLVYFLKVAQEHLRTSPASDR